MNVLEKIITEVDEGARFKADFKERSIKLNGKKLVIEGDLGVPDSSIDLDEWLDTLEDLYDEYKYSRPTAHSMAKAERSRFKGLTSEELVAECGHGALSTPINRDIAEAKLEGFIVLSLISGAFNPDELFAKDWFFQGADKDLVLIKNWF